MQTILFDWDGTIFDSMPAILAIEADVCRQFGLPFDLETFRRCFSPNWRRMYAAMGIPSDRFDEAAGIWRAAFDPAGIPGFPGVRDALAQLSAAGHNLGLVTGGDRDRIEPLIARLELAELIDVRVYADDTSAGKPDPEPLLLALERFGVAGPGDAIYVGDALDDMRMAAAAGVRGVGIVSMVATAEDLLAAGAVEAAGSVVEWVDRFIGESAARG